MSGVPSTNTSRAPTTSRKSIGGNPSPSSPARAFFRAAQARTTLQNGLDLLSTQQANLDLATEVARVAKVKFQSGVGSNVELITAETDLREAQTNYYAALYDALVAKVEFQRANGSLYQPQR